MHERDKARAVGISYKDYKKAHWIRGVSLIRYYVIPDQEENSIIKVIAHAPSDYQLENGCDRCDKKHSNKYVDCSFNQNQPTPLTQPILYNIETREVLDPQPVFLDEEVLPRATTWLEYYRIVATALPRQKRRNTHSA